MSQDRFEEVQLSGRIPYARIRVQPDDVYAAHHGGEKYLFVGEQRAPAGQDEAGALCTVDLGDGDRAVIYAIPDDKVWRRVELKRRSA